MDDAATIDPSASPWVPPAAAAVASRPSMATALLACLGVATDPRKLVLAALGMVALWGGWSLIGLVFGAGPRFWTPSDRPVAVWYGSSLGSLLGALALRASEPPRTLMAPWFSLFGLGGGTLGFVRALLEVVWGGIVGGLMGGAIVRIAVVRLARGGNVGAGTALRFALGRLGSLVFSPLTPLLGAGLLALPCALMGVLLYQIPGSLGTTIAGALAFVPLLLAVPLALLLVGLAAGWPLMVATIVAEGEDTFDALSRSYAYASQRATTYAWGLVLALGLGMLGALAAAVFGHLVVHLAEWSLAFGAPDAKVRDLFSGVEVGTPAALHGFWVAAVAWLVRAWSYAFFWTAVAQIYLLLRRDVDGTPGYEVYQPSHDDDTFAAGLLPSSIPPTSSDTPIAEEPVAP